MYDSFSDTQSLSSEQLRRLLSDGDGPERVWAAWRLGLNLGSASIPELAQTSKNDPSPGVRQHLVILLAGAGEWDALVEIAVSDVDHDVRATAAQFVARLATGRVAATKVLLKLLGPPASANLIELCVPEIPSEFAPDLVQTVAVHLPINDQSARAAVVDKLSSWAEHLNFPLPGVVEALRQETDKNQQRRIAELWWRTTELRVIINSLTVLQDAVVGVVLELANELRFRIDPSFLRPIFERGPETRWEIGKLLTPDQDPACRDLWLLIFLDSITGAYIPITHGESVPGPFSRLRHSLANNPASLTESEERVRVELKKFLTWSDGRSEEPAIDHYSEYADVAFAQEVVAVLDRFAE